VIEGGRRGRNDGSEVLFRCVHDGRDGKLREGHSGGACAGTDAEWASLEAKVGATIDVTGWSLLFPASGPGLVWFAPGPHSKNGVQPNFQAPISEPIWMPGRQGTRNQDGPDCQRRSTSPRFLCTVNPDRAEGCAHCRLPDTAQRLHSDLAYCQSRRLAFDPDPIPGGQLDGMHENYHVLCNIVSLKYSKWRAQTTGEPP